jgi:ferredoxin-type protein NapG
LERRQFLRLIGLAALPIPLYELLTLQFEGKRLVRPPGSIVEDRFIQVCARCGGCVKTCPTGVLVLATLDDGFREIGTPKINALRGACERIQGRCQEGSLCEQICPTGAIQNVQREDLKIGSTDFEREKCIAANGGSCLVCYEVCPVPGAITFTDENIPLFSSTLCVGCGRCVYACPAQPRALTLTSDGERRITA